MTVLKVVGSVLCALMLLPKIAVAIPEIHRTVLPDGVRLITKTEPAARIVAICICIRTEPDRVPLDDAAGELVVRSLFSSTLNRSQEKLSAGIAQTGGRIQTVRTAEHVTITCEMIPSQVREAIYLLCDVLKNAEFGGLERVRTSLLQEQQRGGSGISGGMDVLRRALQARPGLSELPYSRVTLARASAYFLTHYVPDHTAIAVVGPFDAATVETAFHDSLADFDRVALRAVHSSPLYSHATNNLTRTLEQAGTSANALVATCAPSLSDDGYPAFLVLKSILGEGHASRLFQRLRDAQGIGYNVGATWQSSLSEPLLTYLQWEAGHIESDAGATGARKVDREE